MNGETYFNFQEMLGTQNSGSDIIGIYLPSSGFSCHPQANVQVSLCPWQAISHLAPDTFLESLYFLSLMLTNSLHSYPMYTFSGMKFLHFTWIISAFLKL